MYLIQLPYYTFCSWAGNQGLPMTVRTLYHWAVEPPGHITNNSSPETYPGYMYTTSTVRLFTESFFLVLYLTPFTLGDL